MVLPAPAETAQEARRCPSRIRRGHDGSQYCVRLRAVSIQRSNPVSPATVPPATTISNAKRPVSENPSVACIHHGVVFTQRAVCHTAYISASVSATPVHSATAY